MIKLVMRDIVERYPEIGRLHADYKAAQEPRDKHRTFQLMFEQVVMRWVAAEIEAPGVETWADFQQRVRAGMRRITSGDARGRNVAAFSSVGAITVCLQAAVDCSDRTALNLGWRLRNCSETDFVFNRDRVTLEGFNAIPHLEDASLWTYR